MKERKEGLENIELTNDAEYYTVPEIIEQAKSIFAFSLSKSTDSGDKTYRKIKQAIYRALEGKPSYQPKGTQRKRMYPRWVVYNFLNTDYREYFIRVSREQAEKEFEKWSARKDKEKTAKSKEKLEKAKQEEEKAEYTKQVGEDYRRGVSQSAANQGRYEDNGEPTVQERIEAAKKEIFFQFLFDSLIDFNVDRYVRDLENTPAMPEDAHTSDTEAMSVKRLTDLRNYYTGKVDLASALRHLCNMGKPNTQTK